MVRIINNKDFGGFYTSEFIENNSELVNGWVFTEEEPNLPTDKWDGSKWLEVRTLEEINKVDVPEKLSRMDFEMQVLITTGIEWGGILNFINSLTMSEFYKKLLIIRFNRCVILQRNSEDLNTIATMMGITQLQLDEIFINGNLID